MAMGSILSGCSSFWRVVPLWPSCPPAFRFFPLPFFFEPRLRFGSFDGGVLLLELLVPSFPRSKLTITTRSSIIARICGEDGLSSRNRHSTLFSVSLMFILPIVTSPHLLLRMQNHNTRFLS